ncbi:hypothetical protein PSPO01_11497 [Paraphaeosphaeria sporulosa]
MRHRPRRRVPRQLPRASMVICMRRNTTIPISRLPTSSYSRTPQLTHPRSSPLSRPPPWPQQTSTAPTSLPSSPCPTKSPSWDIAGAVVYLCSRVGSRVVRGVTVSDGEARWPGR